MDPIMKEVFAVVTARQQVTDADVQGWLDAKGDSDAIDVYVWHVAPAINQIEDEILDYKKLYKRG
jgi:hypothetical protein